MLMPDHTTELGKLLRAAGRAMYGDMWIGPLARDLGISPRNVRRFLSTELSKDQQGKIRLEILKVLRDRAARILQVAEHG